MEIYGALWHKIAFRQFSLSTDDPIIGWRVRPVQQILNPQGFKNGIGHFTYNCYTSNLQFFLINKLQKLKVNHTLY